MPIIFEQSAGRVTAVLDDSATGLIQLATVEGGGNTGRLSYLQHSTIITSVGVSTSGNYQFLHSVGGDVYVYVFGDRIGQVDIQGISFPEVCFGGGAANFHGFERLQRWYNDNRIARLRRPIRVILGRQTAIDGFLLGLTQRGEDATTRAVRFTLQLSVLPG
jgi:hypothetical protein